MANETHIKRKKTMAAAYMLILLLAVFSCIATYGWDVIRPASLSIYHQWGDGMQHYYGWLAFRQSPWRFPIGCFDKATYPDVTSIIFTDSLPILATVFKLFGRWLPHSFQYFGIWAMFCYALQGVLAVKLLSRFFGDSDSANGSSVRPAHKIAALVLGAAMFLFVPTVVIRQFAHEALGGQWIILLAWDVFLDIYERKSIQRILSKTGLLGFLAAGTHIYFLPFCGIILVGGALLFLLGGKESADMQAKKNTQKMTANGIGARMGMAAALLSVYFVSALFTVWLFGGFSSASQVVNEEFTFGNNANLNTLYNPLTYSLFFEGLPLTHQGQDDGSGYLGLGFFVVLLLDVAVLAAGRTKGKIPISLLASLTVSALFTVAFSTYPFLSVNSRILVSTKLSGWPDRLMSVFRCNGRGIWVISYGIMMFGIGFLIRQKGTMKALPLLLGICLLLQAADISPVLSEKYAKAHPEDIEIALFQNSREVTSEIDSGEVKHIVLTNSVSGIPALTAACWAIDEGLTVNRFYLARSDDAAYEQRAKAALEQPAADALYLFSAEAADTMEDYGLTEIYKTKTFAVGRVQ